MLTLVRYLPGRTGVGLLYQAKAEEGSCISLWNHRRSAAWPGRDAGHPHPGITVLRWVYEDHVAARLQEVIGCKEAVSALV